MSKIDDLKYSFKEDPTNVEMVVELVEVCFRYDGPEKNYIQTQLKWLNQNHPDVVTLVLEKLSKDHSIRVKKILSPSDEPFPDAPTPEREDHVEEISSGDLRSPQIRLEHVDSDGGFHPYKGLSN